MKRARLSLAALAVALLAADAPEKPKPKLVAELNHAGLVLAVAYSPDGKRFATAGGFADDKAAAKERIPIRVWDTATHKQLSVFAHSENGPVYVAKFVGNDKLFVGGWEPTLHDASTGKELVRFKGHANPSYTAAVAPDGKLLATGSIDGTVRFWNPATGEETARIGNGSRSVAFAPDGKTLALVLGASATSPRAIRLWDVTANKERATIRPKDCEPGHVTISPEGKRIAFAAHGRAAGGGEESTVRVIDFDGKEELTLKGHAHVVTGVTFSPDGALLASVSYDKSARLWDARTGEQIAEFPEKRVLAAAFSPDGNTFAVSASSTVKLWDITALRKKK